MFFHFLAANYATAHSLRSFEAQRTLSFHFFLLYSISIAGTLDLANERGVELARTYLDRTLAAIEDHRSYEVVPG
jgi:hypothetical protein